MVIDKFKVSSDFKILFQENKEKLKLPFKVKWLLCRWLTVGMPLIFTKKLPLLIVE